MVLIVLLLLWIIAGAILVMSAHLDSRLAGAWLALLVVGVLLLVAGC
jgi:hypothetical protein